MLLYGFIPMFILAVSLRTFPIFFQRSRVQWRVTMAIWVALNGALVAYVAGIVWHVYDISADTRVLQTGGMLAMGVALIAMVGNVRIFEGNPHRLHVSSRQSMRFARSAYAWLLLTAAVQVFFAVRALLDRSEERRVGKESRYRWTPNH